MGFVPSDFSRVKRLDRHFQLSETITPFLLICKNALDSSTVVRRAIVTMFCHISGSAGQTASGTTCAQKGTEEPIAFCFDIIFGTDVFHDNNSPQEQKSGTPHVSPSSQDSESIVAAA